MKILYAASEIAPFLTTSLVAAHVRDLSQYMQENGAEIRILVPKFGIINERQNKLHDVVRLSGTNIKIGTDEKPLVIKVASIPAIRLQVYFIYNEDYFKRKSLFHSKDHQFFQDNAERVEFFCKGVLETVKKLEWAPEIIHCHDWTTSLVPTYLKTTYRNDPIFRKASVVWTLYNRTPFYKFDQILFPKVAHASISTQRSLPSLVVRDFENFIKTGIKHADRVIKAEALQDDFWQSALDNQDFPCLGNTRIGQEAYRKLYTELVTPS